MRICYVGWADYPHVQRIARWFAGRGHEVHILSNHDTLLEGVAIHNIAPQMDTRPRWTRYKELGFNISALRPLRALLAVRRLVKEIKPDILHSQSLYYPGYLAAFSGFQPYIITVWAIEDILPSKAIYTPLKPTWLYQSLFRLAVRRAKLVTGISRFLVDQLVSAGVGKDKTALFNWGVDLTLFHRDISRGEAKKRLGLEGMHVVVSPRNIGPNENVAGLAKVIPQVLKEVPNTIFLFYYNYAHPKILGSMRQALDHLGLQNSVRILGRISYSEVPQYLRAADVMVSIPFWDSGPLVLQEAMACGVLPVMSNLPSVREWITDGVNGLLVNPKDPKDIAQAILRGAKDQKLRRTSERINWELVNARGSYEKNMPLLENRYLSLLEQKASR